MKRLFILTTILLSPCAIPVYAMMENDSQTTESQEQGEKDSVPSPQSPVTMTNQYFNDASSPQQNSLDINALIERCRRNSDTFSDSSESSNATIQENVSQNRDNQTIAQPCLAIKTTGGWTSQLVGHYRQSVKEYVYGPWETYGDAILSGIMHEKHNISNHMPPLYDIDKLCEWGNKFISLGHQTDRVICSIIHYILHTDSNSGIKHLVNFTKACQQHDYQLGDDTIIFAITALAFEQKREDERKIRCTKLQSNIRINTGCQPHSDNKSFQEAENKQNEAVILMQKEALIEINDILRSSVERIEGFSNPIPHKTGAFGTRFGKLCAETYRRILGDKSSCGENLLNGTLEQCIADFRSCPYYKIGQLFKYLHGESSEILSEEDITDVFLFLRGRVTLTHEADRVARALVKEVLTNHQKPTSVKNIEELNKMVEACNKNHYHLHPNTNLLIANSIQYLKKDHTPVHQECSAMSIVYRSIVDQLQDFTK